MAQPTTAPVTPIRGRGRPFKLTEARTRRVVSTIRVGAYPRLAAEAAGLSKSTFYNYMNQGEQLYLLALDRGMFDLEPEHSDDVEDHQLETRMLREAGWPERDVLLVSFYRQVSLAEGQAQAHLVQTWYRAAIKEENWRAARDFLARRWPRRWGPNSIGEPDLDWLRNGDLEPTAATAGQIAHLTVDQIRAVNSSPVLRDVLSELLVLKVEIAELRAAAKHP